eukprot:2939320-Pyramimonas_sp.AAC.1
MRLIWLRLASRHWAAPGHLSRSFSTFLVTSLAARAHRVQTVACPLHCNVCPSAVKWACAWSSGAPAASHY